MPNVFVTLEVLVLPSGCDSEQAVAGVRQTQKVFVLSRKKSGALRERTPPPLTVTEISISALECLVLQLETHLVRGGLSGNHLRRVNLPGRGSLTRLDLSRRIRIDFYMIS